MKNYYEKYVISFIIVFNFLLFTNILSRNFGLDIIRSLSIWMVLLQHGGYNIPGLRPLTLGGIGVEFFFVLSGFLIGGILFKEINKNNTLSDTLKNFWIRRWFRILPLYYLMLLITYLFYDNSIGWNILYYIFFLQNNFYGIDFMGVSWSLVIEEWFYLISPFYLFYVLRHIKSHKHVMMYLIIFILFIIFFRVIYVLVKNPPYSGINGNFPFRFDSLFIGVLLSYLRYSNSKLYYFSQQRVVFYLGCIFLFLYTFYYWNTANPVFLVNENRFIKIFGFFILPFSIGLILPYIESIKFSTENIFRKYFYLLITWTSLLTYSIYLIHPFVYKYFIHKQNFTIHGLNFIVAILIVYLISYLVYRFFEKPVLNLREKLSKP